MLRSILSLGLVFLLAWGVMSHPPAALAQSPAPSAPATPPATPGSEQGDADQQFGFSVDIEVVTVPVTVTQPNGQFVTDLDLNDFTIVDNGVPQKIESFELSQE